MKLKTKMLNALLAAVLISLKTFVFGLEVDPLQFIEPDCGAAVTKYIQSDLKRFNGLGNCELTQGPYPELPPQLYAQPGVLSDIQLLAFVKSALVYHATLECMPSSDTEKPLQVTYSVKVENYKNTRGLDGKLCHPLSHQVGPNTSEVIQAGYHLIETFNSFHAEQNLSVVEVASPCMLHRRDGAMVMQQFVGVYDEAADGFLSGDWRACSN